MTRKKPLTNIKKGDILEKAVKEVLLKFYPWVEGPPVKTRFCRRDYFGLFDFIVANKEGEMIGIQVSCRPIYDKNRDFKEGWKKWTGPKVFVVDAKKLEEELSKTISQQG